MTVVVVVVVPVNDAHEGVATRTRGGLRLTATELSYTIASSTTWADPTLFSTLSLRSYACDPCVRKDKAATLLRGGGEESNVLVLPLPYCYANVLSSVYLVLVGPAVTFYLYFVRPFLELFSWSILDSVIIYQRFISSVYERYYVL